MDMFFPFILLLLLLLSLPFLFPRKQENLPPGPYPWPIVGNLFQIGKKPYLKLANMARTHGTFLSLKLGTQVAVVASSAEAASQILKTHDRALSARYVPRGVRIENYGNFSLVWSLQCDEDWKKLRSICRAELFSPKMLGSQAQLRENKVWEMVGFLKGKEGKEVRISEVVFATVFNMLGNLVFSRDVLDLGDGESGGSGMKSHIWRMMELVTLPNVGDYFPALSGLDLQGIKREVMGCVKRLYDIWDGYLKERREGGDDGLKGDFLDVLVSAGLNDFQIKSLLLDMFVAGTDTTTATIEWMMAELIKNPEAMHKVRIELLQVIGYERKSENIVKESHLMHLTYLYLCIKETLRLHPPAPVLLHRAIETCKVMGYTIPRDCLVILNVWAIGRDPKTWPDPLAFSPDRFINSDLDYKGNNFEFIPFGAGRRICPGMSLAVRSVELIVASLIHSFDWCLPNGMHPTQLNMDAKCGLTLQKEHPLVLVLNSRT